MRFEGKGISVRLYLLSSNHLLTSLSETIQEKRKNHYGFVCLCPVSTVSRHVPSTQKEYVNIHEGAHSTQVVSRLISSHLISQIRVDSSDDFDDEVRQEIDGCTTNNGDPLFM